MGGSGGVAADAVRATLAVEAWTFTVLLAAAFSHRRYRLLLPPMLLGVAACIEEGPWTAALEPHLALVTSKMGLAFVVVGLSMGFLGGLPTMVCGMTIGQTLAKIHSIHK